MGMVALFETTNPLGTMDSRIERCRQGGVLEEQSLDNSIQNKYVEGSGK